MSTKRSIKEWLFGAPKRGAERTVTVRAHDPVQRHSWSMRVADILPSRIKRCRLPELARNALGNPTVGNTSVVFRVLKGDDTVARLTTALEQATTLPIEVDLLGDHGCLEGHWSWNATVHSLRLNELSCTDARPLLLYVDLEFESDFKASKDVGETG